MKHVFFFLSLLYAGIVSAQKPILEVQVQTRLRGVALLDSTAIRAIRVSPTLSTSGYTGTAADTLCIARQGATTGQVLKWNGSAWAPGTDATGTTYTAGTGISLVGNVVTNTGDTDAGNDITTSTTAGGDLSGIYPSPNVARVQGHAVSAATPATGQVLKWNGSAWAPAADASLTTVQGLATFTPGGTTITIPGTLPTDNAQIWIWRGPMPLLVCPGCGAERVGTSNNFNVSRAIRTGETFSYKIFF